MATRRLVAAVLTLALAAGAGAWASTVVGLSIEDQARLSEFVVAGEVMSVRGVRHPQLGLETAVMLKVTDVFKGSVKEGQVVIFHTRSGSLDGEISEAIGEAVFFKGQKNLVFIESVEGRRYNLGLSMGVWEEQEDRDGQRGFKRALQDGLEVIGEEAVAYGPLSFDDMRVKVEHAARNSRFDNETLRELHGQGR